VPNDRAIQLLTDLIALPSVNPVYDPASPAEGAVSDYVEKWATGLGLEVHRQQVFPGRDNVRVLLAGPEGSPHLLLEAHMDTVGVTEMTDPFTPVVANGRVTGRGACDTKGSLAAMMAAVESLVPDRDRLACTVELLAAVDEETSGKGARAHVAAGHRADGAIVGEPTDLQIVNRHNGVLRGNIEVTGKAAHTSVANEGINAIDAMAEVIVALRGVNLSLADADGGPAANGSLTVSLIEGGSGINIVPETCVIQYDRRVTPGQASTAALAEIDAALDTVRAVRPEVRIVRHEPWLVGDALFTSGNPAILQAATAASAALGLPEEPVFVPYGSDASKFASVGIPTIVFGPGSIAHAHSATEFVPVSDVAQATDFYREVALRFGS
jgi:succinyl-diaminopimelate desuccinylase